VRRSKTKEWLCRPLRSSRMPTYLTEIVAAHRKVALADDRDLQKLIELAQTMAPTRGFREALAAQATRGSGLIAEIKRRSPSKGPLALDLDPAVVAQEYEAGGATCLSVLTDGPAFGGSDTDLRAARAATRLPVLRKDFTVDSRDICDARLMGADAVLLIVAVLADAELEEFISLSEGVGLDALVEVHDERELERALGLGAQLVGVNQRDLVTFEVDIDRAVRLAGAMPPEVIAVAESGVRDGKDAARLAAAGYAAVLVGESIVTAVDHRSATAAMVGYPVTRRNGVLRGVGQ
jgi:indole-3-glycerol phosphate synthase